MRAGSRPSAACGANSSSRAGVQPSDASNVGLLYAYGKTGSTKPPRTRRAGDAKGLALEHPAPEAVGKRLRHVCHLLDRRAWGSKASGSERRRHAREVDPERDTAVGHCVDPDEALALLDDPVHGREAAAG